jgi:hypothetical protein
MKKIIAIISLISIAFTLFNCKKKEYPGSQIENDSIALKHVIFDTAVRGFILNNSDSIYLDIYEYDCYNGPHKYNCSQVNIKSTDTSKIKLSYGGNNFGNLKQDSIIDSTLYWCNTYLSGGWVIGIGEIGYRSEYIGIKYTDRNHIFYGWLHTPTSYKITEYAIDTTTVQNGTVRAGQILKY